MVDGAEAPEAGIGRLETEGLSYGAAHEDLNGGGKNLTDLLEYTGWVPHDGGPTPEDRGKDTMPEDRDYLTIYWTCTIRIWFGGFMGHCEGGFVLSFRSPV